MAEESREVRAARILQNSLLSNRQQKRDFANIDMDAVVPGFNAAMNIDPLNGWHCCLICKRDIKRLEYTDPLGRPGRYFRPLPTCQCIIDIDNKNREMEARQERKRRLQRTYAKSIMAASLQNATLDNFQRREGTERAKEKADEFVATWDTRASLGILFFGPVGNGKSHLARAIEVEIDKAGWATLFLDWPQLTELAKATFNGGGNLSVADYVRGAIDADLLVLDEIGAGKMTEWEFKSIMFPILNGRQGKRTIFTTNLDLERLADWFARDKENKPLDEDGRLIDRIIGSCEIIKNNGSSKRREDAMRRVR